MSLVCPWSTTTKLPTTMPVSEASPARKPTMQEIMDEEYARQLFEEDCRALAALESEEDSSDVFSDLDEKPSGRELLGAHSFYDDGEDDAEETTVTKTLNASSTNTTKSKQGFDRSLPLEGAAKGLNSIRESFRRQEKEERHGRVERAKFATHDAVLDERTTRLLQKLINRGDLDQVFGCVQSGKEANVYYATGTDPETFQKREYAVKIFKTTLNTFSNRKDYITGDRRFDLAFQKKDRRRQMQEWSEKEFRNLSRAVKCIHVPEVIAVKEHIVVMSFIGNPSEGLSAPTLKEVASSMTASQLIHAYADVMQATRVLFQTAKLVHSDLSEYNVLYHKNKCWLIDFGQAVDQSHPQALDFLRRDLANVRQFFQKHGLTDAATAQSEGLAGLLTDEEAFDWVTAPRDSDARQVIGSYTQLHKLIQAKLA